MQTASFKNHMYLAQTGVKREKLLLYLIFYYPAFFSLFYYFFTSSPLNLRSFFSNIIVTTILLLFSKFLKRYWLQFLYLLLVLLGVYLTVLIEVGYFYLYKSAISESTVFILLETNFSEAGDFVSMYFDSQLSAICLSLFVPLVFSIFLLARYLPAYGKTSNVTLKQNPKQFSSVAIFLFLILMLSTVLFLTRLYRNNIAYVTLKALKTYQGEAKTYKLLSNDRFGGKFSNVYSDNKQDELYVVIIGESTTRHHMSLYNYYRDTNPLLNTRKNELKVYNDVICPFTHTIYSLEKVLTMANYENPNKSKDGSLLQLMNKAGFKTYWISNQSPIGADETLVTALSKAASKSYFANTANWKSVTPYDEKLMIPLKQVLSEKKNKKFIVIHLMGTHGSYTKRYPTTFNKFHTKPQTAFENEKAFEHINEYDNAVLYNDYIVNNIIEQIKKDGKKSWVLYFSDHGEDVYETMNMATHTEKNGTKPMYDIPFFIWFSEKYKQQDNHHEYVLNRKYMTDDVIYTIADLSNVHFSEFDATRSIVNPGFVARKRFIGKNEDYDKKFYNK